MKLRNTLFLIFVLAANIVYAQLTGVDLNAIEATTPLSADEVPAFGTFYSAANPSAPPLPANMFGLSAWDLQNGAYLLDDVGGSSVGRFHTMDDSAPYPGGYDGGDGDEEYTNNISYSFPTNGLWLWVTNVANNTFYANLNNATDFVYEVFSTTNLSTATAVTNWNIETEVFPGANTNEMPFVVPLNGRNPLFLWARDWTGITNNGNVTPEWWFFRWYGVNGLSFSDNDLDMQGNTLYYDYLNNDDPNLLQFSISVTNQYVSDSGVPIQINVTSGQPFYIATLIDSTNFAGALWSAYSPQISSPIVAHYKVGTKFMLACGGFHQMPYKYGTGRIWILFPLQYW